MNCIVQRRIGPSTIPTLKHNHDNEISVREYRRGNQKWTIQRNLQQRDHKTKKHNRITTHFVLDITIHKHITQRIQDMSPTANN